MSHKVNIVLAATAMTITPVVGPASPEVLEKDNIVAIIPVMFNEKPNNGRMVINTISGPFTLGETVTGGTSGATGVITAFSGTGAFILGSIVGTFVAAETITGGTSTETAVVTEAVEPMSFDGEWIYEYPTMTVIDIRMADGNHMQIELQNVANQATWNLGTLAALNQAIADIQAWL